MTFSPIKKANVVFDALAAQGIEFPSLPTRVEEEPHGGVRVDINMDSFNQEAAEQFMAMLPVNLTYDEQKFAHRGLGNLLGINVIFRFYIDTLAYEEAR